MVSIRSVMTDKPSSLAAAAKPPDQLRKEYQTVSNVYRSAFKSAAGRTFKTL
jgi:hypothetical protein